MTSLAQGMMGLALVLALLQFCLRWVDAAIVLSVAQGIAAALALGAQAQWPAAAATLVSAIGLAQASRAVLDGADLSRDAPPIGGVALSVVLGAGLTLLALGVETIGLPLALVFLGLLLLATRTQPIMRVIGLFTAQIGTALAAGMTDLLPWPTVLAAAVPIVPALALGAVWVSEYPDKVRPR